MALRMDSTTPLTLLVCESKHNPAIFLLYLHTAFKMSPMQCAFLMISFSAMMSMAFANIFDGIENGLNDAIDATGL
ncbi:unnamed protein product [Larinioides sclopetarius]|uniref:Uncharacterized protein n=1 Tax=Larinioides sclopetarius TaxID=280406 RepID=A0AAV1ZGV9_9ARAC